MSVKVVYQDTAPGAAEDASVTATSVDSVSDITLIPFGGDRGRYATFEPNWWTLDGTVDLYDDQDVAYVSSVVSGNDCSFATAPTITVEFSDAITSLGVYIEQAGVGFCNSVNVKWYASGLLLDSRNFVPDGPEYFCENTVSDYDEVQFTFNSMTHPGRKLRISRILFGIIRTFERDELRSGSARIVQQIDNSSRELPANTLDFKLSSKENVEYIFQTKQQMAAYDGSTLIGVFYVEDSNRQAENIYDITCVDAIGVLENDVFPDTYYNGATALSIAEAICGDFDVDMQADLQSVTLTGILYQQNRRTALQQLCFALGAVADTSGTDKIKIFTLGTPTPTVLDEHRLRPGGSVSKQSVVTAVKVTAHSYSTSGSGSGIVINGTTYYDTPTVTTVTNPDATASDKANVIEVSDCTLISPANVATIAQHLLDEVTRRNTHRVKFRLNGEEPGEYVQTVTPWETQFLGHYISGSITLSGFALTDAEVIGV
jgi:hypothetical protein